MKMAGFQCVTLITKIHTYPEGCRIKSEILDMWCLQSPGKMVMKYIKPSSYWSLRNRLEATRIKKVYDPIVFRSRNGETHVTLETEYWL